MQVSEGLLIQYSDGRLQEWEGKVIETGDGPMVTLVLPLLKHQDARSISLSLVEIDPPKYKFETLRSCLELTVPRIPLYNFSILLPCCAEHVTSASYNNATKTLSISVHRHATGVGTSFNDPPTITETVVADRALHARHHSYMSDDDMSLDEDDEDKDDEDKDDKDKDGEDEDEEDKEDCADDQGNICDGEAKIDGGFLRVVGEERAWCELSQVQRELIFSQILDRFASLGTGSNLQACWETVQTYKAMSTTPHATHRLRVVGPVSRVYSKKVASLLRELRLQVKDVITKVGVVDEGQSCLPPHLLRRNNSWRQWREDDKHNVASSAPVEGTKSGTTSEGDEDADTTQFQFQFLDTRAVRQVLLKHAKTSSFSVSTCKMAFEVPESPDDDPLVYRICQTPAHGWATLPGGLTQNACCLPHTWLQVLPRHLYCFRNRVIGIHTLHVYIPICHARIPTRRKC